MPTGRCLREVSCRLHPEFASVLRLIAERIARGVSDPDDPTTPAQRLITARHYRTLITTVSVRMAKSAAAAIQQLAALCAHVPGSALATQAASAASQLVDLP